MRYRALDANGDYTFGQNGANMLIDSPAAVAQAIDTRLKLRQGEWFLDRTEGVPYDTQIVGMDTAATRDLALQTVILDTQGVNQIADYASYLDPETREFTMAAVVNTEYGQTTVTASI